MEKNPITPVSSRPTRSLLLACLCASLVFISLPKASAEPRVPKLVLLIVVDQMRADYLDRFRPYFGTSGFNRLLSEGINFKNAFYDHHNTQTCPGHALIGSGIYGYKSGITANNWYDPASGKAVYCVSDPKQRASDRRAMPASPVHFEAESLAQRVKQRYPSARVVGVSLKDRSAILMVGPGADAAYWFDPHPAAFVSSSYYSYDPNVLAYNSKLNRWSSGHDRWDYSLKTAPALTCPQDDPRYHADELGLGKSFPHPIHSLGALEHTSWGIDLLTDFTEHLLTAENLGRNPSHSPDVLAVSYSSPDMLGHDFGPDSCEVADAYSRLDASLGHLLGTVEKKLEKRNVLVVLTSDHGVAQIPEILKKQGRSAGRIIFEDKPKISELPEARLELEKAAARTFGYKFLPEAPLSSAFVASFQEPTIYLNRAFLRKKRISILKAQTWLKNYIPRLPGVRRVYTADEIFRGKAPRPIRRSFRRDRAGDLLVALRENWIWAWAPEGTNHGESYEYDAHVPILIWGEGLSTGTVAKRVSVAQIAPTIARFLDLSFAGFDKPQPLIH